MPDEKEKRAQRVALGLKLVKLPPEKRREVLKEELRRRGRMAPKDATIH